MKIHCFVVLLGVIYPFNLAAGGETRGGPMQAGMNEFIQKKVDNGIALKSVAFTDDGWVAIAADGETRGGGRRPEGMNDFIQKKVDAGMAINFVAFTSKGGWVACSR